MMDLAAPRVGESICRLQRAAVSSQYQDSHCMESDAVPLANSYTA